MTSNTLVRGTQLALLYADSWKADKLVLQLEWIFTRLASAPNKVLQGSITWLKSTSQLVLVSRIQTKVYNIFS